jgi:EpsI family protein
MSNPAAKQRPFPPTFAAALACAVAGAVLFQWFGNAARGYVDSPSLFWWWISQWIDPQAEAEHGWLILAVSGWLLWRNLRIADRGLLVADSTETDTRTGKAVFQSGIRNPKSEILPALAAMIGGLALHAVGFAAQQGRISIVALLLFAWGVLRLGGGRRWGAAAAFPLAFLVFAIPVNVLDSLGFWLRMWVIDASAALAHAAGIGVAQSGTQLLAADGRYNYDVAAACSGVRSLAALAALSLLAGYLNFRSWWRRALVLLACFPLVYLGNVVRIASIVFVAQVGGQKWGERAHDVMGFGVFAIVLGGVLLLVSALRRWWPEEEVSDFGSWISDSSPPPTRSATPAGDQPSPPGLAPGKCHLMDDKRIRTVAGLVVGLAVGEMFFLHHLATLPPRGGVGVVLSADGKNPAELPTFLGREWVGRFAPVTAIEREILPADTGYSRMDYVATRDGRHVFLSIVLSGRDRTSIHRPELCLVGQGWTITGRAEHRFAFPGRNAADFTATVLRVRREVVTSRGRSVVPQLVAYWFVDGDAVVATHWGRFLRDAWNRVVHARADRWAYVLLQVDASDGEPAALARMQSVLDGALPAFQRPLPGAR